MRTWKIIAIASGLGAALIVLIVRQGGNDAAYHTENTAPKARTSQTEQSPPTDKMFDDTTSDGKHG
jgi:hypothetical protein